MRKIKIKIDYTDIFCEYFLKFEKYIIFGIVKNIK
jgi:hypothetical protein